MNRFLGLLACSIPLLIARQSRAQLPLGTVTATINCMPSKVLADPVRARVYVTDTTINSLFVIDTTTLQVTASVPVGSDPVDMAISRDGGSLYVANNGSTAAAVAVVDLNTLTLRTTFALPGAPKAIAAGLDGRVYVSAGSDFQSAIYQLDGATGAVQTSFGSDYYSNDVLQVTPDGTELLSATLYDSPCALKSFDVSTATPAASQTNTEASENAYQLVVSHNGKYVCLPGGGGNVPDGGYETYLFSTADINAHYGAFNNGIYPGFLAFSPDDSLVYQNVGDSGNGEGNTLQVFNTTSFVQTGTVSYPAAGSDGYPDTLTSMTTDNTGSYLFIGENAMNVDEEGQTSYVGQVVILATGTGTLTASLPSATITATVPEVVCESGQVGKFTITLSSPASTDLQVDYSIKGSALNGLVYAELSGMATIKAGQTSKVIKIKPAGNNVDADSKVVKLTLVPGSGYTVGVANKAKVKIFPAVP